MQTIGVDGRVFAWPAHGMQRYVTELYGAIHLVAPRLDLIAVGAPADTPLPAGVTRQPARSLLPTNLGWQLSTLPAAVSRLHPDVFHAPAYTAPLWGCLPLVVTVHDVSYARHPEWYPHQIDPLRRAFYRASARRATRILTDSEFSRAEIVAAYDVDPSRIDVVPLAAAGIFTADAAVAREPFVLHVGDVHRRRNLPMLLDAVIELARGHEPLAALRLVLAGVDRGELEPLRARAREAGASALLEYVGPPDDATLVGLYRRAAVLAYPSRYEGFGLPLVEAMSCGAPVVASTAGSIAEVVGDAALLCDPDDARGWQEALKAVLLDPARSAEMSDRGRRRASTFTWARTAELTLEAFERAVQGSRA